MRPDRVSSHRKKKIQETDQNQLIDITQRFSLFYRRTGMVTSPWQRVPNLQRLQKLQQGTRQDEVNNTSSVQDATPTSSVQDATTSKHYTTIFTFVLQKDRYGHESITCVYFSEHRRVQHETRKDEANNASSVHDATPTSSLQDATNTDTTTKLYTSQKS